MSLMRFRGLLSLIRLRLRVFAGKIYNLAGVPGIVRDCNYAANVGNARIQVRAREMFTIITVNGLDIYFHRLSGKIDGVGFSGCTSGQALQSVELPLPSALRHGNARKHTT